MFSQNAVPNLYGLAATPRYKNCSLFHVDNSLPGLGLGYFLSKLIMFNHRSPMLRLANASWKNHQSRRSQQLHE
jgi:hypothetical protein